MPPKTGQKKSKDAALKSKIAKKRTIEAYPAQTCADLCQRRARLIASQLHIKYYAKLKFPEELVPAIKEKMLTIDDCTQCDGPCRPDDHIFPAVVPEDTASANNEGGGSSGSSESGSGKSRTSQTSEHGAGGGGLDDSPPRSVINNLHTVRSPTGAPVLGPVRPFLEHVDQATADCAITRSQ